MIKGSRICFSVISALLVGGFVSVPVLADGPVDISIVEVSNDGSGGFSPWQDITSAMPGETYSAIPRVVNNGSVPVEVRMCIFESATNSAGETINMRPDTFGITINENWTLDNDGAADTSNPASGNCYKYNSTVNAGDLTEPLFSEVTLNAGLENEYQGATFNLHLDATATGDEEASDDSGDSGNDNSGTVSGEGANDVGSPDTGENGPSYFEIVSPVFYAGGVVAVFALVAFMIKKFMEKRQLVGIGGFVVLAIYASGNARGFLFDGFI